MTALFSEGDALKVTDWCLSLWISVSLSLIVFLQVKQVCLSASDLERPAAHDGGSDICQFLGCWGGSQGTVALSLTFSETDFFCMFHKTEHVSCCPFLCTSWWCQGSSLDLLMYLWCNYMTGQCYQWLWRTNLAPVWGCEGKDGLMKIALVIYSLLTVV